MSDAIIKYSIESYNMKKRLMVSEDIDCEFVSRIESKEGLYEYAKKVYGDIRKHDKDITFAIIRLLDYLSGFSDDKKGILKTSCGLNLNGTLANGNQALIDMKLFHINKIEQLRTTPPSQIFSKESDEEMDISDDEEDEDYDYDGDSNSIKEEVLSSTGTKANIDQRSCDFVLRKNQIVIYPAAGPHIPPLINSTITINKDIKGTIILDKLFEDYPFSDGQLSPNVKSDFCRFQKYNANLKASSKSVQDKEETPFDTRSCGAFYSTETVMLDIANLQAKSENYFKKSDDEFEKLKADKPVTNRLEATTKVKFSGKSDFKCIDLFHTANINLIMDLLVIMKNQTTGYDWLEAVKLSEFFLRAIRGKCRIVLELFGKPSAFNRDYFQDMQRAIQSVRTMMQNFYSGRRYLYNNNRFAPSFDLLTGRIVLSPFNDVLTSGLHALGNDAYKILLESLNFGKKEELVMYNIQEYKDTFKRPLSLMNIQPTSEVNLEYVSCKDCHIIFKKCNYSLCHTCVVAQPSAAVKLDSLLHLTYLTAYRDSLKYDQMKFVELVVHERKNGLILCAGGAGKTYLLKYLIQLLETTCGPHAILKASMTLKSAADINAVTLHSLFCLGAEPYELWLLINKRSKESVEKFRKDRITVKRALELCLANFLIIDEVGRLNVELFEFIDLLLQQVRDNASRFGGIQLIFGGDHLQPRIDTVDDHVKKRLIKDKISRSANGGNVFLTSVRFHEVDFYVSSLSERPRFDPMNNDAISNKEAEEWKGCLERLRISAGTLADIALLQKNHVNQESYRICNGINNKINEDEKKIFSEYGPLSLYDFKIKSTWMLEDRQEPLPPMPYKPMEHLVLTTENVTNDAHNKANAKFLINDSSYTQYDGEDTLTVELSDRILPSPNSYFSNFKKFESESNLSSYSLFMKVGATFHLSKSIPSKKLFKGDQVKVTKIENNTITIFPLNANLVHHEFQITKCTEFVEVEPHYLRYNETLKDKGKIIFKRIQYPLLYLTAIGVQKVVGLTIKQKVLYDNSRSSNSGHGYTAASRVRLLVDFDMMHVPKNLIELNERDFKCDSVGKIFEKWLSEVLKESSSVRGNIRVDPNGNVSVISERIENIDLRGINYKRNKRSKLI